MIGIGIAGAGYFAAQHVRALASFPDLRLVAVAAARTPLPPALSPHAWRHALRRLAPPARRSGVDVVL